MIVKSIDNLLAEADELLENGEEKITENLSVGYLAFRKAVTNLLRAYLIVNGQEPLGDVKALFFQCLKQNQDFEEIDEVMSVFAEANSTEADIESIIDSANEIWDFISGMLPTVEEEL